ncbi:MAG TPA: SH3-like domain-containing protein [Rubrobacter sp.]|nr:SH3-like domain-containing protein [Rubrobacter sp.]
MTFEPGDRVRVLPAEKPGHVRTPGYLKGKTGWIESVLGEFPNPEELAYGFSGRPERLLYKVGFRQADLWDDYDGPAEDRLCADVYEHWLEPEGGTA